MSDLQVGSKAVGSPPMPETFHQKHAMVLEDEDPRVGEAESGGETGNRDYDESAVRVKTAELKLADES